MKVYYYVPEFNANGVRVITYNLGNALKRKGVVCEVVDSLSDVTDDSLVIPGGVKNGINAIKNNLDTEIIILGDAISLGYLNKIIFYLKEGHVFNKDFVYSIYAYLRYKKEEKLVIDKYKKVVMFSQTDVEYLKKAFKTKCQFIVVPNGANFPESVPPRPHNERIKVGILSSWGSFQSFEENNWFIKKYWRKFAKSHPNYELVLCGRGPYIRKFDSNNSVKVLGEVESLYDFFGGIDVFLTVNPKGCGILNRVLDAIAFEVPIVGIKASFSGFQDSAGIYTEFHDYNSFVDAMDFVSNHYEECILKAKQAVEYAKMHNDWENNYNKLVDNIIC